LGEYSYRTASLFVLYLSLLDTARPARVGGVFTLVAGELSEAWWTGRSVVRRSLTRGALRSFGANHVHDVSAAGDQPAYSVPVYSPKLEAMRTYRIDAG
jgi:hypothetical protein